MKHEDEVLDKRARRQFREWKIKGLVGRLPRVERPDYSKCNNQGECEAVSHGVSLALFRKVYGDDEAASIEAAASLEQHYTGGMRSLASDDAELHERSVDRGGDEPEGMDPEVADVLRRLGLPVEFSRCKNETEYQAAKRESGAGK